MTKNILHDKLALGLISGLLGGAVILFCNRLFLNLGLVQNSLNSMSLQVVKCRRRLTFTTKKDIWLSHGITAFFCLIGSLSITYLLSFTKHLFLLKGFIIGTAGGLIPSVLKKLGIIKGFRKSVSKIMCLLSHGFFGLTVALITRSLGDKN
jgi:hypothetical protein